MAWGLGLANDHSSRVMKGAKDVLGYGASQLGGFMSTQLSSFKSSMGKVSNNYMEAYKQKRSDIANDTLTGKYGGKYSSSFDDGPFMRTAMPQGSRRRQFYNLAAHDMKDMGKGLGVSAALGGAIYGLSAFATDNSDNDMADRGVNFAKHGVALTADLAGDTAIAGIGMGLAMFGPAGALAGGALNVANIAAGLMGYDAGSIAMNIMNYGEEAYDKARNGPKFNMTQNTSMALERQIQNLHASGSNLGEMMHN